MTFVEKIGTFYAYPLSSFLHALVFKSPVQEMDVLVKACAGILAYAGTRKKRCAIYGFLVQSNLKSLMPNVLHFR